MEFLLDKAALKGLSEEDQKAVKEQAFNQFLLGSVFGGRGIASGYDAVQGIIPGIQKERQKAGLLQELTGIQQEFFPTPTQAASRAVANMPELTPTEAAARQQQILGATPDYPALQTRLAQLALNPAAAPLVPGLTSAFGAFKPTVNDGVVTNIRNQPTAVIPRADLKTGLTLGGNVQDGRVNFEASDIAGFADANARNQTAPLAPGTRNVFDPTGRRIGTTNDLGAVQALTERTLAEEMAKGQARLATTPTNVLDESTGRTRRTTEQKALGAVTALSPAEDLAFKGYEPIRNDAFKKFQAASSSDASLQNLQNIINRGAFEPGKFAAFKAEAAAIATGLGIGGDRAKQIAVDSPLFLQSVADVASANIQDLVGATSDKDLQFSATRGPQITNPKEAVQYYLDLTRVANQRKKDYFNYVTNNPVPNVVESWSQTEKGKSSIYEDPKLRKYLPQFTVNAGPDKGKKAYQLPTGVFRVYD